MKDAILTISTEATQEAALEELLAKVTTKWTAIEFSVIPYKDSKDIYILGAIDDIQVDALACWFSVRCSVRCLDHISCSTVVP